jgi:hypothetical protein
MIADANKDNLSCLVFICMSLFAFINGYSAYGLDAKLQTEVTPAMKNRIESFITRHNAFKLKHGFSIPIKVDIDDFNYTERSESPFFGSELEIDYGTCSFTFRRNNDQSDDWLSFLHWEADERSKPEVSRNWDAEKVLNISKQYIEEVVGGFPYPHTVIKLKLQTVSLDKGKGIWYIAWRRTTEDGVPFFMNFMPLTLSEIHGPVALGGGNWANYQPSQPVITLDDAVDIATETLQEEICRWEEKYHFGKVETPGKPVPKKIVLEPEWIHKERRIDQNARLAWDIVFPVQLTRKISDGGKQFLTTDKKEARIFVDAITGDVLQIMTDFTETWAPSADSTFKSHRHVVGIILIIALILLFAGRKYSKRQENAPDKRINSNV